jgi:3-oxoisoapionate decarboxylase
MMRAGFSSYAVGWALTPDAPPELRLDPGGVIALAERLGYQTVQLADNAPLDALSSHERQRLQRQAESAGISIELGTRGLSPQTLERYVDLAREFSSPFLRTVVDVPHDEPDPGTVIKRLRDQTGALARAGVILAVENHDRFGSATLAEIMRAVDSPWVGICLDTANSFGAGEDVRTVLAALGSYVVNVHLKDVRARRVPYLQGFTIEGTPLGTGQVPLEWVVRELERHGRCQSATLEHWVPPDPHLEDTIRKERKWCEQSTVKMRELLPAAFATAVASPKL